MARQASVILYPLERVAKEDVIEFLNSEFCMMNGLFVIPDYRQAGVILYPPERVA